MNNILGKNLLSWELILFLLKKGKEKKTKTYAVLRTSGCNPYSLAYMNEVMD